MALQPSVGRVWFLSASHWGLERWPATGLPDGRRVVKLIISPIELTPATDDQPSVDAEGSR